MTAAKTQAQERLHRQQHSRSSRVSRRSASGPACTSAPPPSAACTTWCWEVVDNSVDEALAGYGDRIEVTLLADGGVRVIDNGRGMPGRHAPDRRRSRPSRSSSPCCTPAESSTASPTRSPAACTASASRSSTRCQHRLEVEIERDGFHWSQPYVDQKPAAPLKKGDADQASTGTTRHVLGRRRRSSRPSTYYFETISRRLQEMAFLNKGLTIVLRDERADEDRRRGRRDRRRREAARPPRRSRYHYTGRHRRLRPAPQPDDARTRSTSPSSPSPPRTRERKLSVEVAMQWNASYSESVLHLRQHDQHASRAAPTRRASGPR